MTARAIGRSSAERKIISISDKRQITIPLKYYKMLRFNSEAECILQNNAIVIRPVRENMDSNFAERILADLISQGFSGQELLAKFREASQNISSSMQHLIDEADSIANGDKKSATLADIFNPEDK